jgi:hypothetical protein
MAKAIKTNKKNKCSIRIISSKNDKTIGFVNLTDEFCKTTMGVTHDKVTEAMLDKLDFSKILLAGNVVLTDHTKATEVDAEAY